MQEFLFQWSAWSCVLQNTQRGAGGWAGQRSQWKQEGGKNKEAMKEAANGQTQEQEEVGK